jgi:acyl carrier protein
MVPAIFVPLEKLPLTPNGKIDRRALPAPGESWLERKQAFVSPGTETEKIVAAIWQRILKVERVGIYDNFFDLGGHSLLVIQIQVELMAALNRDIAITDLFRYTTVSALAEYLGQSDRVNASFEQSFARVETRLQSAKRRIQNRQKPVGE